MPDRNWRVLIVDDDKEDYLLTREMLSEAREGHYLMQWASSYEAGKQLILSEPFDAILMDYQLGPRSGLDLTREVYSLGCKAPIILLTGRGNYSVDMEAMNIGITDYLAKGEASASLLERTIRYAIQKKQNEEALRAAKQELELRVKERTRELTDKNAALEAEIAERKRVEGELAEMQRRLLDHVENERLELARDLHDSPMQELYGLAFQLDLIPGEFENGQGSKTVESAKERLMQVIHSLRSISRELRPPALAPYGLEKAIRSHVGSIAEIHPELTISLHLDADGRILPEAIRLAFFRIYQTAISNVLRHAQATEVMIQFRLDKDQAYLEVRDNGCGFEVPRRWITLARQGHMGLVGAAERAEAAGGRLEVESQPGQGTSIKVFLPRAISGT